MNKETKTLKNWIEFAEQTGKGSIYDYLNKGDIVSEDIVDYFIDLLPPVSMTFGFVQVGEAVAHVYDISHILKPVFMTFAKMDNKWRYLGNCFKNETIDRF